MARSTCLKIYQDNDDEKKGPRRRSLAIDLGKPVKKPPVNMRKSVASQPTREGLSFGCKANKTAMVSTSNRLSMLKKQIGSTERNVGKSDISFEKGKVGRKALADVSNVNDCQNKGRKRDSSLPTKVTQTGKGHALTARRVEKGDRLSLRSLTIKRAAGSRITRQSTMTVRTSIQTKLKASTVSKSKLPPTQRNLSTSAAVRSSADKESKNTLRPLIVKDDSTSLCSSSLDKSQPGGTRNSGNAITTVIARPRKKKRRSFTSMLMARSEDKVPNIDDKNNELEVAEYVEDIYQFYWTMEAQSSLPADYMVIQTDITPRMRAILINWLIEVHMKFELMPETLFLMVELLDRFLSANVIKKNDMQLVGLTTLLIASKYEDFWHPKVDDLISISSDSYTREEMLSMERFVLNKLRFRLNAPTPYVFMRRFLKAAQADAKLEHLSFYLVELCQTAYEALKFKASLLCASSIYLARCTLRISPAWTTLLQKHTDYEEMELRPCAEMILRFQKCASVGELTVSYEKYLSSKCSGVAGIKPINRLPAVLS
ncbi:putative cyclin-B3-1 isoform X2 [Nymphaea colorata]|uniref:putative cyclin-B3-1 isoform X2 n=1 Tax=Nymphaea colorata TaxID=210225 RepID=UPI00129E55A3|nr:putative cyclin-B3-1 isoform X2 [Nymphaea colorata]